MFSCFGCVGPCPGSHQPPIAPFWAIGRAARPGCAKQPWTHGTAETSRKFSKASMEWRFKLLAPTGLLLTPESPKTVL